METMKKSKPAPSQDDTNAKQERNIFSFGLFNSSPPMEPSSVSKPESTSSKSTTKVSWKSNQKSKSNLDKKKEPGGGESGKNAAGLFAAFAKSAKKLSTNTTAASTRSKKTIDPGGDARAPSPLERNIFASMAKSAGGSSTQNGDVEPKKRKDATASLSVKKEQVSYKNKTPALEKSTSPYHRTKKETPNFEISLRTGKKSKKCSPYRSNVSQPVSSPSKKEKHEDDFNNIFASLSMSKNDTRYKENYKDSAGDGNAFVGMKSAGNKDLSSSSGKSKSKYAIESPTTTFDLGTAATDFGSEFLDDDDGMMYIDDNDDFDFNSIDDEDFVEPVNDNSSQITKSGQFDDAASDHMSSKKAECESVETKGTDGARNDTDASFNSRSSNETIEMVCPPETKGSDGTHNDKDASINSHSSGETIEIPYPPETKSSDATRKDKDASVNSHSSDETIEMEYPPEEPTEFVNILEEEERLPKPFKDTGGLPVLEKIVTDSELEELDQPPPLDACTNEHAPKSLKSPDITDGVAKGEEKIQHKHTCAHKHTGVHKHASTHIHTSTPKPCVHKNTCGKKQQQQHTCSKVRTPTPAMTPTVEVLQPDDTSDDLEVILVKKKKKKKKRKQNKGDPALKPGDKLKDKSKHVGKSIGSVVEEDDADVLLVEDVSKDVEIEKPMQKQKPVESGETGDATSEDQKDVKLMPAGIDAAGKGAPSVPPEVGNQPKEKDVIKDKQDTQTGSVLVKNDVKASETGNDSDVTLVDEEAVDAKIKTSATGSQDIGDKAGKSGVKELEKEKNLPKVQGDKKGEENKLEVMITEMEDKSDKVSDCGGKEQMKDGVKTIGEKTREVEEAKKVDDITEVMESDIKEVEEVDKLKEKGEVEKAVKDGAGTSEVEEVKKVKDGVEVIKSGSKQVERAKPVESADKTGSDDATKENEAEKMETDAPPDGVEVIESGSKQVERDAPVENADKTGSDDATKENEAEKMETDAPVDANKADGSVNKADSSEVEGKQNDTGDQRSDKPTSSTSNKDDNDGNESLQTESIITEDTGTKGHFFDMSFMSEDNMDVIDQSQSLVNASIDSFLDNSSNFSYTGTDRSSEFGSSLGNRDLERPSTSQEDEVAGEMDEYEGNPDVDDIDGITFLSFDSRDELDLHLESLSRPKEQIAKKKKEAAAVSNADQAARKQVARRKKRKKLSVMTSKPKTWVALNYHALMNELEENEEKLLEELEIHGNREILHPALKDVRMCLQVSTSIMDPVGMMYNLDPVGVDLSYEEPPRVSQRDIFFPQRTKTSDYTKVKGWRDTEDTEGKKWKTLLVPKSTKVGPKSRTKGKPADFVKPQQVPHSKQKTPLQASAQSKLLNKKRQYAAQVKKSPPAPPQTKPKSVVETTQKTVPKLKITGVKSLRGSDISAKPMRRSSLGISRPRYLDDTVDDQFIADYIKPPKKTDAKSSTKKVPEREPIELILPKPKRQSPKSSRPAFPKSKSEAVPPITLAFKKPKTAAEAAAYGIKHAKILKKRKTPVLDEWDVPTVSGMKKPVKDFASILSQKIIDIADDEDEKPKIPIEESRYFTPFEKPVTSKRSAFVSDALDAYLQKDKVKGTSQYSPCTHPLLQNQSAMVTFQMPTKQQRGIKTLHEKLEEGRRVRLKALTRLQSLDSNNDVGMVKSERKVEQSENKITVKPFVPSRSSISEHIANEKDRKGSNDADNAPTTNFTSVLNKGLNERIAYLKGQTYEQKLREKMELSSGKYSPLESEDSGSEDVYSRWGPTTLGNIKGVCRTKATAINSYKRGTNQGSCRIKATEIKTKSIQGSDSDIEIISSDNSDIAPASTCRTKALETTRYAEITGTKKVGKKSAMMKLAKDKIKASQSKQQQGKSNEAANSKWKTQLKMVNSKLVHRTRPMILSHSKSFMPVRDPTSPPMKSILPAATNQQGDGVDAAKKDLNQSSGMVKDVDECVIIEDESDHDDGDVEPLPACGKDFCRLGCICDSLERASNQNRPRGHCNKAECMLKCVCDKATEKTRLLRNRKRPSRLDSEEVFFYDTEGMMSNIPEKKKPRLLVGLGMSDTANSDASCARTRLFNAYLPVIFIKQQQPTEEKPAEPDLGSLVLKPPGSEYLLRVDPITKDIYAVSIKNPKAPVKKLPAKLKTLTPPSPSSSENQMARIDTVVSQGQAEVLKPYFPNVISASKSSESTAPAHPVSFSETDESGAADNAGTESGDSSSQSDILSANVVMESIANQEGTSSEDGVKKKKKKDKKQKKNKEKDKEKAPTTSDSVLGATGALQGLETAAVISGPVASNTVVQQDTEIAVAQPLSTETTMQATQANVALPAAVTGASQEAPANVKPVSMLPATPSNPVMTSPVKPDASGPPQVPLSIVSMSSQLQNIASQGGRFVISGTNWCQGNANPVATPAPRQIPVRPASVVRPQVPILLKDPVRGGVPMVAGAHPGFPAPVRLATPGTLGANVPAIVIGGKAYALIPATAAGKGTNVQKLVAVVPSSQAISQGALKVATSKAPVIQAVLPQTGGASTSSTVSKSATASSSSTPESAPSTVTVLLPKESPCTSSKPTVSPQRGTSTAASKSLSAGSEQSPPTGAVKTLPSGVQSTSQPIQKISPVKADLMQQVKSSSSSSQKILSGPMLIEIQSDCNWERQKNEILSEIAKHTTAAAQQMGNQPGRTAMRVGKYVVEIVNKQQGPDAKSQDGAKMSGKSSTNKSAKPTYESKQSVELGSEMSEGVTTFFPPVIQQASSKAAGADDDDDVVLIDDQSKTNSSKAKHSRTKQQPIIAKVSGTNSGNTSDDLEIIDVPDSPPPAPAPATEGKPALSSESETGGQNDGGIKLARPSGQSGKETSPKITEDCSNTIKLARPTTQGSVDNTIRLARPTTEGSVDNTIRLARPGTKDSEIASSSSADLMNKEATSMQSAVDPDKAALNPIPVGIVSAADLTASHSNKPSTKASEIIQPVSVATSSGENMQPVPIAVTAAASGESIQPIPTAVTVATSPGRSIQPVPTAVTDATSAGESEQPMPKAVTPATSAESLKPVPVAVSLADSSEESIQSVPTEVTTSASGEGLQPVMTAVTVAPSPGRSVQPVPTAVTVATTSEESIQPVPLAMTVAASGESTQPVPMAVTAATSFGESIQPVPTPVTTATSGESTQPVPIAVTAAITGKNLQTVPTTAASAEIKEPALTPVSAGRTTPNKPIPLQLFCSSPMLPALDTEAAPQKKNDASSSSSSSDSDSDSSDSEIDVETCDDNDTAAWVSAHQRRADESIDIETVDPHLDSVVANLKQKLGVTKFVPILPKEKTIFPKKKQATEAIVHVQTSNPSVLGRNQGNTNTKRKRKSPVLGKPPCEPEPNLEEEKSQIHNVLERQRRQELRTKYNALRDEVFGDGCQKAKILILNTALEEISRLKSQAERLREVRSQLQEINYKLSVRLATCCGMKDVKIRRPVERTVDSIQPMVLQTEQNKEEARKASYPSQPSSSAASSQLKQFAAQSSSMSSVVPSLRPSSPMIPSSPETLPPPSPAPSSLSELDIAQYVDSSDEEGGNEQGGRENEIDLVSEDEQPDGLMNASDGAYSAWQVRTPSLTESASVTSKISPGFMNSKSSNAQTP